MQLTWFLTSTASTAPATGAAPTPSPSGGTSGSGSLLGVRDLLIDPVSGDLALSAAGDLLPVSGLDALMQSVRIALQLVLGEWFADPSAGVDWFGSILGQKTTSSAVIRQLLTDAIKSVEGITGVPAMDLNITGRELALRFTATSDLGTIQGTGTGTA